MAYSFKKTDAQRWSRHMYKKRVKAKKKGDEALSKRGELMLEQERAFIEAIKERKERVVKTFDRCLDSIDDRVALATAKTLGDYIIQDEKEAKEKKEIEMQVSGTMRMIEVVSDDKPLSFEIGEDIKRDIKQLTN